MYDEIIWLSHGGPGSGRYPKGSGKKYEKKELKRKVKSLNKNEKERTRNYYKYLTTNLKSEKEELHKKDIELINKSKNMVNDILSNKNVRLKDIMKIDFKSYIKYQGKIPFAGAYSAYKLKINKK